MPLGGLFGVLGLEPEPDIRPGPGDLFNIQGNSYQQWREQAMPNNPGLNDAVRRLDQMMNALNRDAKPAPEIPLWAKTLAVGSQVLYRDETNRHLIKNKNYSITRIRSNGVEVLGDSGLHIIVKWDQIKKKEYRKLPVWF